MFGEIRSMLHGGKKLRSDVLRASYAQDPVYYQEVVLPYVEAMLSTRPHPTVIGVETLEALEELQPWCPPSVKVVFHSGPAEDLQDFADRVLACTHLDRIRLRGATSRIMCSVLNHPALERAALAAYHYQAGAFEPLRGHPSLKSFTASGYMLPTHIEAIAQSSVEKLTLQAWTVDARPLENLRTLRKLCLHAQIRLNEAISLVRVPCEHIHLVDSFVENAALQILLTKPGLKSLRIGGYHQITPGGRDVAHIIAEKSGITLTGLLEE